MSNKSILFIAVGALGIVQVTAPPVWADPTGEYSFLAVSNLSRLHAPEIIAAKQDLESARIYENRMSRHWVPRVFVEGRAFATNDPATNFMSLLEQRQIGAADFVPQALNQPVGGFFERGTLGMDFPLFEGGAKVAALQASTKMTAAKSFELRQTEIAQYAELASHYSSILSLLRQNQEFLKLNESVEEILVHYKIGTKSNPVGYSGLLGLKSLRNHLQGHLVENAARTAALRERIRIVAEELPENWSPEPEGVREFVAKYLRLANGSAAVRGAPASVHAMHLAAESLEQVKDAEKARVLPKVGLFAAGDLYGGGRGSATSYSGGAYLQWDLFSAQNFGAVAQAEHTAAAAQARADGMSEHARIERFSATQTALGLEKNLKIMDESEQLLAEQTTTAKGLFLSGSINALQFVEVLARRAELIVSRAEAELGLAHARSQLFINSSQEGVSLP